MTAPAQLFAALCKSEGLPAPTAEHRFHPTRKWRMDFAWVEHFVALEVEGGVWIGGRHNRGSGYLRDVEKYNAAAMRGWLVLKCTPDTLCRVETVGMVRQTILIQSERWLFDGATTNNEGVK